MKLGMHVGLGPGHIALDGDSGPPPPKGHSPPNFRPISIVVKGLADGCSLALAQMTACYAIISETNLHCYILRES